VDAARVRRAQGVRGGDVSAKLTREEYLAIQGENLVTLIDSWVHDGLVELDEDAGTVESARELFAAQKNGTIDAVIDRWEKEDAAEG
jgi:hypothetical protein